MKNKEGGNIYANISHDQARQHMIEKTRGGKKWIIVLAGGSGQRMRSAIYRWFGENTPKQFCTFVGSQSMLEHTWNRARTIVDEKNIVTVAVAEHLNYFSEFSPENIPGSMVYQPTNRGTAAAILLGLAHILAEDPQASVMVLPSDHFIHPEELFTEVAQTAFDFTQQFSNKLILLGAESKWPNEDYGWIEARSILGNTSEKKNNCLLNVRRFTEKPDYIKCHELYENRAFWSTMIFAAKGEQLWRLSQDYMPNMLAKMSYLREVIHFFKTNNIAFNHLKEPLRMTYLNLSRHDFSADFIQKAATNCCVLPMQGIEWDDWGRPERIVATARQHGLSTSFKLDANEYYSAQEEHVRGRV